MNGWRGVIFLRVIVLRIENPYNSLRQIANLPQRGVSSVKCQVSLRNFGIFKTAVLTVVDMATGVEWLLVIGYWLLRVEWLLVIESLEFKV